jgi:hypothetical protein
LNGLFKIVQNQNIPQKQTPQQQKQMPDLQQLLQLAQLRQQLPSFQQQQKLQFPKQAQKLQQLIAQRNQGMYLINLKTKAMLIFFKILYITGFVLN